VRRAPCCVPLHSARIMPVAVEKVTRSGIRPGGPAPARAALDAAAAASSEVETRKTPRLLVSQR
jgi:hypothetical protein